MEIKLNIDQANFGATIEDVFKTLSYEDKKSLASQCMLEVLQTPTSFEREMYAKKCVERIIASHSNRNYDKLDTDAKARASYEFREMMSKYESSSEKMVKEIVTTAILHYKELVVKLVTEDEQLNKLYEDVKATIVENFPAMVQAAVIAHFAKDMGSIGAAITNVQGVAESANRGLQNLTSSLRSQGLTINV